ncbi:hypothetical protein [Metabacillus rhizolycopersici]|uniref:HEAT repeat domain-containing protein n=1 Tax=Metabacillus rhizolycopersici TaxID=2875709 RepID=A0ABS7UZ37_9BACI|nr:hypothetical protein [Metabacillus rhizolycopersici]MBZ5753591.1 hypothetical protein [Metabacillus rhizolycopersici]
MVQRKAIAALVSIGRIGEPEEVAYVVSLLLSDEPHMYHNLSILLITV